MAFNGLQPSSGPFTLAPGAQMRVIMWYGDPGDNTTGQDYGAQWIMANPIDNGQPPTELVVSDHSKILGYSVGTITENGNPQYGYDPSSAYYNYGVTVTNWGSSTTSFNIQGGGNT